MLYPIYCAQMLSLSADSISFRIPSGKICSFKSNITLLLTLLQKCTGTISADEIALAVSKEINIPTCIIMDAIVDLVTCEIFTDSHEQLPLYHPLTNNPPKYPPVLTFSQIEELTERKPDYIAKTPIAVFKDKSNLSLPIYNTLYKRYSCRDFLSTPIDIEILFSICKAAYSYQLRPVASAGALFPLSIYFINRITSKGMPAGLYQYDPLKEEILLLSTDFFIEAIQYSLNDEECIFGAPCIFFICGDIRRHTKKYANRGYRYMLLEAGHVVQNMTIAAIESELGGVEYGGFYDEAVKRLFQMPIDVFPLACYAIGYEDITEKHTKAHNQKKWQKYTLEKIVHNKELNISPFLINDKRFRLSNLQVVISNFKDTHGYVEFGTGVAPTYDCAYLKSIMESYERYTLSYRYFDRLECASNLNENYLDPRIYVPYSKIQIEKNGLAAFQIEDPVEWLKGYTFDGDSIYIPADLCFNVTRYGSKPYHIANTSGCAAHFDRSIAEKAALLELIERDAIARTCFYHHSPCRLNEKDLPDHIQARLQRYQKNGISLFILILPCEYAITILVCSVNNRRPPYFVSGAGASFFSLTEAIDKAFNEWEVSFVLDSTRDVSTLPMPENVISPKDHGDLYKYRNYNNEIDYLLHGPQISAYKVHANQLKDICSLSPVYLSYRTIIENIFVIRAFSKELIPINFGYGMDFLGHHKVNNQLLNNNGFPHFFA